jgi:hypothetical protein
MSQVRLDLYQNGIDSIKHAIEHYVDDSFQARRYKYAILHLAQGVLLLLKERLRKEHPNFIFVDVATDPASGRFRTVDSEATVLRLRTIAGVDLETKSHAGLIRKLTVRRNFIEHYAVDISRHEADSIIVQTIQFLQWFVHEELGSDFREAVGTNTWEKLLQIREYHTAEVTRAKREIAQEGLEALHCPTCDEITASVVGGPVERARWRLTTLEASCLVCHTTTRGVACLRCGKGITLDAGQVPQLFSYCEDCRKWASVRFAGVSVRNSNYPCVAEVYRWFQEHETISAHQLWELLRNVSTAGSSAPDYPTSLYRAGVIDFLYEGQREDFERKKGGAGRWGIMGNDPYIFQWSYDRVEPTDSVGRQ